MKLPNWIDAHVRAFEYYGGVPRIIIPDNTKTAVKVPSLVDPQLNASYLEMAWHYGTTLVPARPGKLKDKAADENMVGNISRRIIAALRNYQFFSLFEINQAIKTELNRFINRPFQKLEGNRLSAFSYKYFSIIIKQMALNETTSNSEKVIANNNLRGAIAYVGGGLNV